MLYKDPSRPVKERVAHLLSLMAVEEKIGQLVQPFGWQAYSKVEGGIAIQESFKQAIAGGGVGALYGALRADPWTGVTLETGLGAKEGAEATNALQRYAIEQSRLGIPLLFGEETSHGHMSIGATVFPVPLVVGSSWNPRLYQAMCEAIARETRARGGAVGYSPVLDVVRDPRWGRTEECYAEDPYLIGVLGEAAVLGMQGAPGNGQLADPDRIIATLKHFVAYGSSEGGRNAGPAHIGTRELHEVDLAPFKRAVQAGAYSLMTAYNEIDGVPCTINDELTNGLLREQWGFEGFIITDCGAIEMLADGHDVAADGAEAAIMSLGAGIDMEMSGVMFSRYLRAAYDEGRISGEQLDVAAGRVLEAKFRLGLFERPYVDADAAAEVIGSAAHIELARQMAREGIVLLKNEGGILPLAAVESPGEVNGGLQGNLYGDQHGNLHGDQLGDSQADPQGNVLSDPQGNLHGKGLGKIAVIGPNADHPYNQLGDYTSPQPRSKVATVLDGIRAKAGAERVLYAPGCRIKGDDRSGFELALQCAAQAEVVVVAIGGSSARDFGEGTIDLRTGASVVTGDSWNDMECGEGIDRTDLVLSGVQLELVQQIHQLGKPIVVVYINGRPIAEPWIDEHAHAILEAWYPGEQGGHAIADLLFGDYNPSGRLPVSIPKHVGQLPVYYNGKRSRGKRYLEMDLEPGYPFGFGLSYTTFRHSNLRVEPAEIPVGGEARVYVEVTNTGTVAGTDVVQLYITDVASSVARPGLELKDFCKIELQPGETQTVSFTITSEQLQFMGRDMIPVVEPGQFRIHIGHHARQYISTDLTVSRGE